MAAGGGLMAAEGFLHEPGGAGVHSTPGGFGADAGLPGALAVRAREVLQRSRPAAGRRRLAAALAEWNLSLGAAPAALQAARELALPDVLAVVAVIRPRPLLGRLAELYPAIGALALAEDARARLRRPVVALAVLASGGRTAGGSLYALARDGALHRVGLVEPPDAAGLRRLGPAFLGRLEEVVGRPWPLAREALGGADSVRRWTARMWARLLSDRGLVVADAERAPLLESFAPQYPRFLLAGGGSLAAALKAAARRLSESGRPPADSGDPGAARISVWMEGRWHSLLWNGRALSDAGGAVRLSPGALVRLAVREPERLMPDRIALGLFLDGALPLLAAVPGDEDLPLFIHLDEALRLLGRSGPVVRPRPRYTLLTPALAAFARAHGVAPGCGPERLRDQRMHWLRDGVPPATDPEVLRSVWEQQLAGWNEALGDGSPEQSRIVERLRGRVAAALGAAGRDLLALRARRERAAASAWRQLTNTLYPLGRDQDQVLAAAPFLAAGAPELLGHLAAEVPDPDAAAGSPPRCVVLRA